jgi:fructoselysine-6-P-deglycase FrlB-like protein
MGTDAHRLTIIGDIGVVLVVGRCPRGLESQAFYTNSRQYSFRVRLSLHVLLAGSRLEGVDELPTLPSHPLIEPLLMAQSFYRAAALLSIARGLDPDRPPRLEKATQTV